MGKGFLEVARLKNKSCHEVWGDLPLPLHGILFWKGTEAPKIEDLVKGRPDASYKSRENKGLFQMNTGI